jgi:hypothetical protein
VVPVLPAAGHAEAGLAHRRTGAAGDDVGEDVGDQEGHRRVEDLLALDLGLPQHLAVEPADLEDQPRLDAGAEAGEGGVGGGELDRRQRGGAERHRRSARHAIRRQAHPPRRLRHVGDADRLREAHRRHVLRAHQRFAHRDLPLEPAVEVPRRPGAATVERQLERPVDQALGQRVPLGQRGGEDERFEGRADLPAGVDHAVEARVQEVAAADPGEGVAGVRGEHDHGSLEVLGDLRRHLVGGRCSGCR